MASFSWPPKGGDTVTSINGETGDVTLVAGANITITPSGQNITIAATGGGGGGIDTIGTIDSLPASSDGAGITGASLVLQSASDTDPGLVNTTTQTFAGDKTIDGDISANNLSGTNTGNVTLAAFGSTPNANGLSLSSQVLNLQPADATHSGGLSSTDWNTFNNKQSTITAGNLTSTPTTNLVVTGGTGAVIGSGALLTLTGASLVEATSSVLTITGATNAVLGTGVSIQVKQAATAQNGYLSSTDWNTFNGKQAAGNYITALTGDVTAAGPGSSAATLATVNANVGSFTNASLTVNAKGLVTAASSGSAPVTTLAAVGSSPNANAATISSNTLNLQPFDGTHPGVVTASGGGTTNFLRADGNWAAPAAGASALNVTSQTSNYSASANDYIVCSGSSFTVTLPTVVGASGKTIVIENNGTFPNQYAINTTSGQTVGGLASGVVIAATPGEVFTLVADPTNSDWKIQDHQTETVWTSDTTALIGAFYTFTVASGSFSGTIGATYTNNGNTYTLAQTFTTAATSIILAGPAAPTATGTLTNTGGTHVGNPIFSAVTGIAQTVSATTTAPVFFGAPTTNTVQWKRSGRMATIKYVYYQATAGAAAGSGDYIFSVPVGMTIDSSVVTLSTGGSVQSNISGVPANLPGMWPLASGLANNATNASLVPMMNLYSVSTGQFQFRIYTLTGSNNILQALGSASLGANIIVAYNFQITVPIVGWQP